MPGFLERLRIGERQIVNESVRITGREMYLLRNPQGVAVLDASTISKDKAVVDAYVNDPLVYRGKTTARLGVEFLNIQKKLPEQLLVG